MDKRPFDFTSDRRALLELLINESGSSVRPAATIPRRKERSQAPLSFAQQRLWFLDQLVPDNPFYNIPLAVRYKTWLNIPILEQSLNELVRRHETLRTSITAQDGIPQQEIVPDLTLELPVVDLRGVPAAERESEALRLATEEARKPFNLSRRPLLRTTLIQLGEADYVFLLTIHHIVSDGWSLQVFARELFELYKEFSSGKPSPLEELPIQYADYAAWQREALEGEVLEEHLQYWRHQLVDLPVLQIPTDHSRPPISSFRGDQYDLILSPSLSTSLKRLSQQTGTTLFMTLLAAFTAQLHRYTDQDDIVVGMPVAGRNRTELEDLIGFFVNTLVLRIDHSGNPSFRTLLNRVRETTLEAYAHQDVPFERLVEELKPERDLSRNPLCQVAFQLFNAPPGSRQTNAFIQETLAVKRGTSIFDLVLTIWENGENLVCRYEFSTDLFDNDTITRMANQFQTMLEGIVYDPLWRLSDLPLLSNEEWQQVLVDWNRTEAPFPKNTCVHHHFEAHAAMLPEAIATQFDGRHLTYGELNRRANQLAHYLQSLGVGPEVLVGLCVERSLDLVVGMLGILKTGGAFMPLDPTYPQQRLAFMISDAGLRILLTQESLASRLPEQEATVVFLDSDWETIDKYSEENLLVQISPRNLAYVIYTSGSTGQPKGVLLEHYGLSNAAYAQKEVLGLNKGSRALQFSSLSFDASVFEFTMAYYNGGMLLLGTPDTMLPGPQLIQLLEENQINVFILPPSALALLPQAPLPHLKTITVGGEACSAELVTTWAPGRHFLNLYGPTEATIWSTFAECESADRSPPIGRPIANIQVYVLDRHLNPVPVGIPGELYVGGVGLARGYLHRPALTAEKFIPHPFSNTPGARLYRTGDLVRYLPDGQLEFLGRIDHQVKLHGFRIELGEIEAVLRQHPAVQQAVVLAREDNPGEKRLVAYMVSPEVPGPPITELRRHLKQQLPEYMLPGAFVFLSALPLTPNGKVNRAALPPPSTNRPELEADYVSPRTPVEITLADIWAKILGLKQVGIHDNFFDLGGDSILSIQIVSQANQAGLQLTPRHLFLHQTIAELALVTGTMPAITAEQGLVTGAVPLTPIQHWFFEQKFADPHHFNQSVLLEVGAGLASPVLEQTVRHLLLQHDALRLRFHSTESGWKQEHVAPEEIDTPFLRVDLSMMADAEQHTEIERISAEQQTSLDLGHGPLIRVVYFDCGPGRNGQLLLVIHHLVVDTFSWRILLDDLLRTYQQLSRLEAIKLPQKTTSFQHWAQRLEQYVHSEGAADELSYWFSLANREVPTIPLDNPDGDNTYGASRTVKVSLTSEETQALLREVLKAYKVQMNEVLLTALLQAFTVWTGARSLLLDLEGHGREMLFDDVDLGRTIGWFTAIFPVWLDLGETNHPGEALKHIKEQLRAVPNNGIGYGLLRYLSPDVEVVKRLKKLPKAEVVFNYLGQFGQTQTEAELLEPPMESLGLVRSPNALRRHLLEINGSISGGRLQLSWTYSAGVLQPHTIERVARAYIAALKAIITHCLSPDAGGYTPSDFPDVDLDQGKLNNILAELGIQFDQDEADERQID